MSEDGGSAVYDNTRIQPSFTDFVFPNRFAGMCLDGMDCAVARALYQQSHAIHVDNDWGGICCIVWSPAGGADPNRLAGVLIKSHEAMCPASVLAPLERHPANDYQLAVNYR